ncbi:MAG: polysaccharide biosynthesis/export family protein [Fervidobacterium sp.]|uniref:polysaccharide biosynthesis/export family protein n=1 Tax=Fervidobacterium sp. TaxID=1871331 RepID=UPI00404B9781
MRKWIIGFLCVVFALSIFGYTLRVGDTIAIEVFGQPQFSRTAKVAFDGTIPYPYAGNIKVQGLTTEQVKNIVQQTVGRFIKDPVVTVYIVDYAPMYVYFQGAVNRTFDISNYQNLTISKLFSILNLSPTTEIDFENIQLKRAGKTQTINMLPFFYEGKIDDDVLLQEGDIIYFPPVKYSQTIQVSGAYSAIVKYEPGLTLKTLLLRLGTLNEQTAVIENSYLTTADKTITVNLKDVLSGKVDYPLTYGASLYIPKRDDRYVYVLGFVPSAGVKTFAVEEPQNLALAIAKAGGISKDSEKWIEKITITTPDGKTQEFSPTILNMSANVILPNGAIVNVIKYEEFKIYLTGDFSTGIITFEPNEPKTLKTLLTKIGGLKTEQFKWIESIKINENKVDLTKLDSYTVKNNDNVEIKKYPEFKIYLTGDFSTGQIEFEPDEPRTLKTLLTKIGGLKTDQFKWIESIKINDTIVDLSKIDTYSLKNNDTVQIKKHPEFKIYLTGDYKPGTITFEPDEPKTLAGLITKIGGIPTDQLKWIESVKINGKVVDISKADNYQLTNGDKVEIKKFDEFYVYVQGFANQKGKITFEPQEPRTLKTLLNKIGLPNTDVENEGKALINNQIEVDLREVIYSNKDVNLSLGDSVLVSYEPFIVYTTGIQGPGVLQLSYYEPKTLSYVVKKLISQPETVEKITLLRNGKQFEYEPEKLIYGQQDQLLEKHDTLVFEQSDVNAVYLVGDVSSYVTFELNEPITIQKILAKVGLSDLRRIDKITDSATTIDFTKDTPIQKGTILNVQLKKPVYVTAMGYIRNTGRVQFDYYETPDLKTLFAKLGGLIIGPELYYASDKVLIIRNGTLAGTYDAEKIFKGIENAQVEDGDFVYVTQKEPNQVYVFGKGVPNGLVKFTQGEEFDLRTLIGKLGGIREGISKKITVINNEKVEQIEWSEVANAKLTNNSILLFDVDKENYIYVINANGNPSMIYSDKPITLYEALTKVGIDKNYRKIELTKGTEKQTIELKDLTQARGYNVYPGDVVRVVDILQNYAFVLGEVNTPGIVWLTEGTTVLQAIVQSGYFTQKAAPSSVWLYKGGVQGQAIRVDLSAAMSGGRVTYNPIVESGDIVFVPADVFKSALDWIPVISSLLNFYSFYSSITGSTSK